MPTKVNIQYGMPADSAAFEEHYLSIHVPLAEKIPGVRQFDYGKVVGTLDGSESELFWVASLTFDDADAMAAALGSPESAAAAADVANLATESVKMFISEVA